MPVCRPELLGCSKDIRPDHRGVVVARAAHRPLGVEHVTQGVQHPSVQRIFVLLLLGQMLSVRQQVIVKEPLRLRIGCQCNLILSHRLLWISVFGLEPVTEPARHRSVLNQCVRSKPFARPEHRKLPPGHELLVTIGAHNAFAIIRPRQIMLRYSYYVSEPLHVICFICAPNRTRTGNLLS